MTWLAALLASIATAIAILRGVVGAVWLHRWLQRDLAPAWALRRGPTVPEAVVEILVRGGDPREVWKAKGAPLEELPEETSRHLPEVRQLLRRIWRVGWLAGLASIVLGGARPRAAVRGAGRVSLLLGGIGLLSVLALFPAIWALYHRLAYASDDWQLPEDVLLAALYPERFYQRAAALWFALLALSGIGCLALEAWFRRGGKR
ncbi:MAG: hypothetical protein RMM58_02695 [Chloroflexota bacterium]|nr:hypothetical protein [Dehalococcoidia bacterium]MDW8252765.1 hypothetical protein [Chloroflexota bacterium]